ncbi:MAG: hypothetical protein MUF42_02305 [Cytophagaceae bacterium]|jgi:hypothetical protein|nr:hypothetical protein [Cytophagaceae bacterium]
MLTQKEKKSLNPSSLQANGFPNPRSLSGGISGTKFQPISSSDFFGGKSNRQSLQQGEDESSGGTSLAKSTGPSDTDYQSMQVGTDGTFNLNSWDSAQHGLDFGFTTEGNMPVAVKNKLKLVADNLLYQNRTVKNLGSFPENFTLSLSINGSEFTRPKMSADEKKRYSGDTVFEFVRLKNGPKRKANIFVRELGADTVKAQMAGTGAHDKKIFDHYFTTDATWGNASELEMLYHAIAKIPASILAKVPSLVFKRKKMDDGEADPKQPHVMAKHTMKHSGESSIEVYDLAFEKSHIRFGDDQQGFSDNLTQTIVHEIGHALDSRVIRKGLSDSDNVSNDWQQAYEKEKLNEPICAEPGPYFESYCQDIKSKSSDLFSKHLQFKTALYQLRSESGEAYVASGNSLLYNDPKAKTGYLSALDKDQAKAGTLYGRKSRQENFAELFSLYILDTKRFSKMYPNVYAYFLKSFPK